MVDGCRGSAAVKWVNCPLANSIPMITAGLYDLVVLFVIAVFAWRGYQKGLVGQLGALLVLMVVAAISVRYTPSLSDFLGSGNTSNAIAFIVIILIVTLIVWNIVNALAKLVTKLKLKSWNNQMGALLGAVNGIFISMLMTFMLFIFVIPKPAVNEDGTYNRVTYDADKSFIKNSFFGPYLTNAMLTAVEHLPQGGNSKFYNNLRNLLQSKAENIKENHPDLQQQTYESNSYDNYGNRQYDNRQNDNRQYDNRQNNNRQYAPQDQYGQQPGYRQTRQPGYQQNQGYPDQRYPDQGHQNQNYPDQRYPNEYQNQGYPNQNYNRGAYPSQSPRQPGSNPGYNGNNPYDGVL